MTVRYVMLSKSLTTGGHMAWSRNYAECRECGTTERAHVARGLCSACYMAEWNGSGDNAARQKTYKRAWYERNVQGTARQVLAREQFHFNGHRQEVLERDGWKCRKCGATRLLVVHHLDNTGRKSPSRDNSPSRLITLCRACHVKLHRPVDRRTRQDIVRPARRRAEASRNDLPAQKV